MAITKTSRLLLAAGTALPANSTVNSTELNLSTSPGARVFVKITNGATPPTTAPKVVFHSGEATTVKRDLYTAAGDTVANSITHISCRYGVVDMFANVTLTGGATTGSTVEVMAQEATTL